MKSIISIILILCCLGVFAQEGKIIKIVDEKTVVINIGKQQGISIGDGFTIYGKGQFVHPATGRIVEADNMPIGELEVTEVRDYESVAAVNHSSQAIQLQYRVERKPKDYVPETKPQTTYNETQQATTYSSSKPQEKSKREKKPKEIIDRNFHFSVGLSKPIGDFGAKVSSANDIYDGKLGQKGSFYLDLGYQFYFKGAGFFGGNKKFGMDVLAGLNISGDSENWEDDYESYFSYFFLPFKIGPILSINPSENLVVDLKATIQPTIGLIDSWYYSGDWYTDTEKYADWYSYDIILIRYGLGIVAKFKPALVGIEYSFGKANGELDYQLSSFNSNVIDKKMSTGMFSFFAGFYF